MKTIFTVILIYYMGCLFSQTPDGRLYFYTGTGGSTQPLLGFIQYPDEVFSVIDTIQLTDMAESNGKLYAAGLKDIFIYDTSALPSKDTLADAYAEHIAAANGQLVGTTNTNPFLNIYDLQTLDLLFSIDTAKITEVPVDVAIWGNKVFVLLSNTVVVVDITLQDTVATISIPSPFPFPGYNLHLVDLKADFYITIGYATGAPRSALMRLNKLTYAVDTAFYYLGNESFFPPVAAGDKIYLFYFDAHYNIIEDSLHTGPGLFGGSRVIAYDKISNALFLELGTANGISYFNNSIYSDTISVTGSTIQKALFLSTAKDTVNSTSNFKGETSNLLIFPNPVTNCLCLELPEVSTVAAVEIYDIAGKLMISKSFENEKGIVELNTSHFQPGCYVVQLIVGKNKYVSRFVKHK